MSGKSSGAQWRPGAALLDIDGAPRTLRLTLGAIAEIEDRLCTSGDGVGLDGLAARLARPRASDLIVILDALLAGGGTRLGVAALAAANIDLAAAARAIGAAFGGEAAGESESPPAEKPEGIRAPSPSTTG